MLALQTYAAQPFCAIPVIRQYNYEFLCTVYRVLGAIRQCKTGRICWALKLSLTRFAFYETVL
jgi:hypothetical protein